MSSTRETNNIKKKCPKGPKIGNLHTQSKELRPLNTSTQFHHH